PPTVHKIDLHTTQQYPLRAMPIDESSLDGTLGVIDNIIRSQLHMSSKDLEEHGIVFTHGDNLTISLIDMAQSARRDDTDTSESLKWMVGQLGLFHVKMAGCRMALNQHWGTPNSKYSGSLWKENSLLGRKAISAGWKTKKLPPFPQSHELIHLSSKARILDGVRVLSGSDSLENWIESKPMWRAIEEVTERVLDELCSGLPVEKMRRKNMKERDITFENVILANRDMLLYAELVAAVKAGDIGRVLNVLSHWMVMMRGTGSMPKYADALLQVWLMLDSWPKELKVAFMNNWLINLSGKEDGWKEVDLNQEHQNFWAKIIYTAKGSNKSWEWLSMVTVCIFMLRDVMQKVQCMYDIPSHGTRHTNPNEKEELKRLMDYFAEDKLQAFKLNRDGNSEIEPVLDLMIPG
ncbi:hypothetical protein M407DRAFT_40834, partial [Tulasnella calospora MUT 4182]